MKKSTISKINIVIGFIVGMSASKILFYGDYSPLIIGTFTLSLIVLILSVKKHTPENKADSEN